MASIAPHKLGFRAQLCVNKHRESAIFRTKREATIWAAARETELRAQAKASPGERFTFADALDKYVKEVSPRKRGHRWEAVRVAAMLNDPFLPTRERVGNLTTAQLLAWRDIRLKSVKPGTVLREIGLLSDVLEVARREWQWIPVNPMRDVRKPRSPEHRKVVITRAQIRLMLGEMGYSPRKPIRTISQAVAVCFLVALRTGMRAGELCGLTWDRVHDGHCVLAVTKTTPRDVPLTSKAMALIEKMRGFDKALVFGIKSQTLDAIFRKYRARAGLSGFTFHDARRTAATWISKKIDVLTLCKMFGWTDPKKAMIYYSPTMKSIVDMLESGNR